MNSSIGLKNYISVITKRIDSGEIVTNTEITGLLRSVDNFVSEMGLIVNSLKSKVDVLEGNSDIPKNQSTNDFVQMVLNKIEILKNMIKSQFGGDNPFSMYLLKVEAIEQSIKSTNTVTSSQLAELNEIYKLQETTNFSN